MPTIDESDDRGVIENSGGELARTSFVDQIAESLKLNQIEEATGVDDKSDRIEINEPERRRTVASSNIVIRIPANLNNRITVKITYEPSNQVGGLNPIMPVIDRAAGKTQPDSKWARLALWVRRMLPLIG